jgi:hypothetical protein
MLVTLPAPVRSHNTDTEVRVDIPLTVGNTKERESAIVCRLAAVVSATVKTHQYWIKRES